MRRWRQERENSIEGSPPGIKLAWKLMPGGVPFLGVYLSVSNRGVITIFPFSPLRLPPVEAGKQGITNKNSFPYELNRRSGSGGKREGNMGIRFLRHTVNHNLKETMVDGVTELPML